MSSDKEAVRIAVKIESNGEKRLLKRAPVTYEELLEQFTTKFASTIPKKFTVQYKDPEEEWIRISSTQDLCTAYSYIQSSGSQKSITFVVSDALSSLDSSFQQSENDVLNDECLKYQPEAIEKADPDPLLGGEKDEDDEDDDDDDTITVTKGIIRKEDGDTDSQQEIEKSNLDINVKAENAPRSEVDTIKAFCECLLRVKPSASDLPKSCSAADHAQIEFINEVINSKIRHALAAWLFERAFDHVEPENVITFGKPIQEKPTTSGLPVKQEDDETIKKEVKILAEVLQPEKMPEKQENSKSTRNKQTYKCKVVSCPNNSNVEPGSSIAVAFFVQNNGEADWPSETELKGNTGWSDEAEVLKIGKVAVGEKREIQIQLKAAEKEGVFLPNFKFCYSDNGVPVFFGPKLSFEVKVKRSQLEKKVDCSITCERKIDQIGESNSQVLELASRMQAIFPDTDQKTFIQFIKSKELQKESVESIVQQYLDEKDC